MQYNPEKHYRRSICIPDYDYSQAGWYFVTICVQNRESWFEDVVDGKMALNEFGMIISESWRCLADHYEYIHLHEWIIIPNHLHGIIEYCADGRGDSRIAPTVITRKPLGRIIGAFKTVSTKQINNIQNTPGQKLWQRNYGESHAFRRWEHLPCEILNWFFILRKI
jgi:putative transposase